MTKDELRASLDRLTLELIQLENDWAAQNTRANIAEAQVRLLRTNMRMAAADLTKQAEAYL